MNKSRFQYVWLFLAISAIGTGCARVKGLVEGEGDGGGGGGSNITIDELNCEYIESTDSVPSLFEGETHDFMFRNCTDPITLTVHDGNSGSIDGYEFTAGTVVEIVTIRATDAGGNTADAKVIVLGNPEIRLDAGDIDGAGDNNASFTDGDGVSSWSNLRGSEAATQGDAGKQPVYVASNADYNGLSTLEFSGSECLVFDTDFHNETSNTIAYVGEGNASTKQVLYRAENDSDTAYFEHYLQDGWFISIVEDTDGDAVAGALLSRTTASIGIGWHDGDTSNLVYSTANGSASAPGTNADYDGGVDLSGSSSFPVLGSDESDCSSNGLEGDVAEFFYYGEAIDAKGKQALECHFHRKFGVAVTTSCPENLL